MIEAAPNFADDVFIRHLETIDEHLVRVDRRTAELVDLAHRPFVERMWREVRLFRIAPITQEMVLNYLSERVLGLPRSY